MLNLAGDWKAIESFKISHKDRTQTAFLDDVPVSTVTFPGEFDQSRARSILESSLVLIYPPRITMSGKA